MNLLIFFLDILWWNSLTSRQIICECSHKYCLLVSRCLVPYLVCRRYSANNSFSCTSHPFQLSKSCRDLNAVIWLDSYLEKWKKTLLVVSHDQDFLNSVCQEILHIEDCKLASYKGNYDSFKKAEKTKLKQQQKAWEKQEKRLRELKRSGQSKAKATEQVKKNKREPGARSAKKKQDQAIAAGTAAAETQELIKRPREYHVKLEFAEVAELSRPVLEVNRVHFRYSPKHPIIFDRIDFGIDMDSRICVVGVSQFFYCHIAKSVF